MTSRLLIVLTGLAAAVLVAPVAWGEAELEPGSAAAGGGEVVRATFTSEVIDREPLDQIETLGNDRNQIAYFSELRGLAGQTVTHRWEFDGKVVAEVTFEVTGARWRVHSNKELDPSWLGEWRVSVVDANGNVLRTDTFAYTAAEAATTPAAPAP
jgi:hypothetical protein